MRFESVWMLLLLLVIPIPFIIRFLRKGSGSVRFSSVGGLKAMGKSWRERLLWLPVGCRVLALACLVVAIARPQMGTTRVVDSSEGIAMEVLIDRSGSMRQEMDFKGKTLNRLEVVKEVFREFALGNKDDLKGRPHDLIGVITFAKYADTICPLTLGHDAIPHFLKSIKPPENRNEDGTAIGDALALAAARLKTAEEVLKEQGKEKTSYRVKSKIAVLLTDGEQTAGKRQPMEAAKLAKTWGIKVYTIGVGGGNRHGFQSVFGQRIRVPVRGADEGTLKAIAEETGGKYFSAEDEDALRNIYKEINRLEKSEINSTRFVDYKERFLTAVLIALGLLALEILLRQLVFRRTP